MVMGNEIVDPRVSIAVVGIEAWDSNVTVQSRATRAPFKLPWTRIVAVGPASTLVNDDDGETGMIAKGQAEAPPPPVAPPRPAPVAPPAPAARPPAPPTKPPMPAAPVAPPVPVAPASVAPP